MLNVTELCGFGAGGGEPSITPINSYFDINDLTTYSFTGINIPRPGLVVVLAQGSGYVARGVVSATIGGVAATEHADTAQVHNAAILSTRVASSGSITISITYNGAMADAYIHVFLIENITSDTPVVASTALWATSVNIPVVSGVSVLGYHGSVDQVPAWSSLTSTFYANLGGGNGYACGITSGSETITNAGGSFLTAYATWK